MKIRFISKSISKLMLVLCVLIWGVSFEILGSAASGWDSIVEHEFENNWQLISESHVYDAGEGWHWIAEAGVWIYVVAEARLTQEMVLVEGGTLSTSNELNGSEVLTFSIGKYEVTWGEWKTVRDWATANGYGFSHLVAGCADDYPVYNVSWYDAVKWCNAKSEMEGLEPVYSLDGAVYRYDVYIGLGSDTVSQDLTANGYRLPLESEWEFAARGGNQSNGYIYAGSDELNDVGWFNDNAMGATCGYAWLDHRHTWPVGQKAANELGLHDMSGNVAEWCWDLIDSERSIRGGGWPSSAEFCTVSSRASLNPINRYASYGFRLARTPSP